MLDERFNNFGSPENKNANRKLSESASLLNGDE